MDKFERVMQGNGQVNTTPVVHKKRWQGQPPTHCDLCGRKLSQQFIDGMTQMGSWAIMDPGCHHYKGVGLGTGIGQRYDFVTLEKLEG